MLPFIPLLDNASLFTWPSMPPHNMHATLAMFTGSGQSHVISSLSRPFTKITCKPPTLGNRQVMVGDRLQFVTRSSTKSCTILPRTFTRDAGLGECQVAR